MNKKIIFRCDASTTIGAGHVIRSMALANRFKDLNWNVSIAAKSDTYDFVSSLDAFERINPEDFLNGSHFSDVLVIDSYDIDEVLEKQFRKYAEKIVVIDDLANRKHDCDILIDQTYGRLNSDYQTLVPDHCQILTGSDFILIRDDFLKIKSKSLEKRKKTKKINKILVTMGGSDPNNFSLKAIKEIYNSEFKGEIDIVLGFTNQNQKEIFDFARKMSNKIKIHTNADMSKLIYEADLAIGASGSGIWERLCLFLPNIIYKTADNQKNIYENLLMENKVHIPDSLNRLLEMNYQNLIQNQDIVDGLGIERILKYVV